MNIDSRFRDDYFTTSSSQFQFELPDIQRKVTSVRIASLDIPMTYYAVSNTRGDSTFLISTEQVNTSPVTKAFLLLHPAFLPGVLDVELLDLTSTPPTYLIGEYHHDQSFRVCLVSYFTRW